MISDGQNDALGELLYAIQWRESPGIILSGSAGTGKTTLIEEVVMACARHQLSVAVTATTNAAANVLRARAQNEGWGNTPAFMGTVHRYLNLRLGRNLDGQRALRAGEGPKCRVEVVIVDEASMLNQEVLDHLLAQKAVILAVGDHRQLPPVGEDVSPVWRQHWPITWLTQKMRQQTPRYVGLFQRMEQAIDADAGLFRFKPGDSITYEQWHTALLAAARNGEDLVALAYTNARVNQLNAWLRRELGLTGLWAPGDRVVFTEQVVERDLFTGRVETLVVAGERGYVRHVRQVPVDRVLFGIPFQHYYWLDVELSDGQVVQVKVAADETIFDRATQVVQALNAQPGQSRYDMATRWQDLDVTRSEFAHLLHGWAMTTHRAQGSGFRKVFVDASDMQRPGIDPAVYNRLVYVAATRAIEELVVWAGG